MDTAGILGDATPAGWVEAVPLAHAGDPEAFQVLTYPDGTHRFRHRCDRGVRLVIVCAPLLAAQHRVIDTDPLTVFPSILCTDCGTHGYITDGEWRPC